MGQLHDQTQLAVFPGGNEGHSHPLATCPAGAADAVHIGLMVLGNVVVDDMGDVVDIDAPGSHIRSHQGVDASVTELLHDPVTLYLGKVTVEAAGQIAAGFQRSRQVIHCPLGAAEDDELARLLNVQSPIPIL